MINISSFPGVVVSPGCIDAATTHPPSSASIPKSVVVIDVVVEMSPTYPSFSRSIADLDVDAVNPMNAMSSIKLKSRMPAAFSDNPARVWTSIFLFPKPLLCRRKPDAVEEEKKRVVVIVVDVLLHRCCLVGADQAFRQQSCCIARLEYPN